MLLVGEKVQRSEIILFLALTGITGSALIATSSMMLILSPSVTPGVAGLILVYLVNIVGN